MELFVRWGDFYPFYNKLIAMPPVVASPSPLSSPETVPALNQIELDKKREGE